MTDKVMDEQQAWDAVEAEENPTLAAAKLEIERRETAADDAAAASLTTPVGELAADDPIAIAQALADEEAAANAPPVVEDPAVKALNDQVKTLQQQLQAQKDEDAKRIRDLNGQYGGLKRELDQVRSEAAAARAATASPQAKAAITEAAKTPESWAALKKEWEGTGMTEAIEEFVASQRASGEAPPDVNALVEARMQQERATLEQRFREQQSQIVDLTMTLARPGWRDVVRSEDFSKWRAAQPPAIEKLATSPNPQDAIEMLKLYDASTAAKAAEAKKGNPRLESAVSHTRTEHEPRRTLSVNDMTPQQLWAYEARLEEQAARRAAH